MLNYRDRSQTRRQTLHETLAHAKQYETMMWQTPEFRTWITK
jgi:hypothetical protein